MIVTYAIIQAGCCNVLPLLHAAEDFVNMNQYDECAPLATLESAIKIIQFEYEEKIGSMNSEVKVEMSTDMELLISSSNGKCWSD
jgi:hypothetical protein